MRRGFVARLRKLEMESYDPRWKCVVRDVDNRFWGDCGEGISQKQFMDWVQQQENDTQVIVVELVKQTNTLKIVVDNYIGENFSDILRASKEDLEAITRAAITLHDIKAKKVTEEDGINFDSLRDDIAEAYRLNLLAKIDELQREEVRSMPNLKGRADANDKEKSN